jgi:hypothetical protein
MSFLDHFDWMDFDLDWDAEPPPTRKERALEKIAEFSRMLARRKARATKPQAPSGSINVTGNCKCTRK